MSATVGLAMIVRDEADQLPRCLASVADWVSQMVVVDTGSQDQTVEVAQTWGAEVIHSAWQDDFAAARNVSLQAMDTDWILVLDADEALVPEVKSPLQASMQNESLIAITLVRQEIGTLPPYSLVSRLFRRNPAIVFNRPYHETIDDAVVRLTQIHPQFQIGQLNNPAILHWGYGPERLTKRDKVNQAIAIMSAYLEKHPEDAYLCCKLGGMYLYAGHLDLAQATIEQGLQASSLEPAIAYELHYQQGNLYAQTQQLTQAIQAYQAAIVQPIPAMAKATCQMRLAQAWNQLKQYPQAIQAYETVIQTIPDHPLAWQNLGVIYLKLGQVQTSLRYFQGAVQRLKIADPPEANRLETELAAMGLLLPKG